LRALKRKYILPRKITIMCVYSRLLKGYNTFFFDGFRKRKNFDGTNHYFWMDVVNSYDSCQSDVYEINSRNVLICTKFLPIRYRKIR